VGSEDAEALVVVRGTKIGRLEGCIVLNEHNTVFARSGPLYVMSFPGPTRVLNANGISFASEFSAGLTR